MGSGYRIEKLSKFWGVSYVIEIDKECLVGVLDYRGCSVTCVCIRVW